jgi:hypothetical protein
MRSPHPVHLIGGGIDSLSAAAFPIRDPDTAITIFAAGARARVRAFAVREAAW